MSKSDTICGFLFIKTSYYIYVIYAFNILSKTLSVGRNQISSEGFAFLAKSDLTRGAALIIEIEDVHNKGYCTANL